MIESRPTLVPRTVTLLFCPDWDIYPQLDLEFTMSNIEYILVTHLQMYKKHLFPKFSTSCRGLKRYGKNMFRLRIGNRVLLKRPLKTLTCLTKQFMDTNV